ncbi:hypothetical protein [Aeromonas sp. s8]|uniref:hypothetical protein n=1 Tax=Aeromonas sp. s8 TaxID=3138489 RepID=UPI0034A21068
MFKFTASSLLFILTALLVIPMKISVPNVTVSYLIAVMLVGLSLLNITIRMRVNTRVFGLLWPILVVILIAPLFSFGNPDFYVINLIFRGLLFIIAGYALSMLYFYLYGQRFEMKLLSNIFYIGVVNSSIAVLALISRDFSLALYRFIEISDNAKIHLEQGYRATGLFYSGVSTLSLFNAVIFFIGILIFFGKSHQDNPQEVFYKSSNRTILALITLTIVFISTCVAGRLGLMLILLTVISVVFFPGHIIYKKRLLRYFILSGLFVSLFLFFYYERIEYILRWAFELVFNWLSSNEFSSKSSDLLFDTMYFLPEREIDIFFGTGTFGRGDGAKYIDSDVGYVLMIFYGGVTSIAVLMFVYAKILYDAFSSGKSLVKIVVIYTLLVIFLANFKDVYLYGLNGINQLLFILSGALVIQYKNKKRYIN